MKSSLWFIILIIFSGLSMQAQYVNKKIIDPKHEKEILIGYCTSDALLEGEFGAAYVEEYTNYEPDFQLIKSISSGTENFDIVLVMGTWCGDSQEQVPRFYRIMYDAQIPDDILTLICVDGNKTAGDLSIEQLGIEFVPTFIFYREGEEIGRITETPEVSLEADMWEIIN